MIKNLLLLLILCTIFTGGCFNYKDMNRIFFTTSTIIDVDDKGIITGLGEYFKAYRGQGEKQGTEVKVLLEGKGVSLFDAFNQVVRSASYEINYTQLKAMIFTKKAAEYGLDYFIDSLDRDQKSTLRMFLFVYEGDPDELIKIKLEDEQFLGLFLDNLMVSQGRLLQMIQLRLDQYMNMRMMGSRVNIVPMLRITETASEKRVEVNGAAVIVNDKMVDTMTDYEVITYNLYSQDRNIGYLVAKNPDLENKYVNLEVLNHKTTISLDYDGKTLTLKKNLKLRVSLLGTQSHLSLLKDDNIEKIEADLAEKIEKNCSALFEKFRSKGIDIYNIQREFEMRYPREKPENLLEITKIVPKVDIFLEGSNNTTDFW